MRHLIHSIVVACVVFAFSSVSGSCQTAKPSAFEKAVLVEVIPQKPSKVAGGDFDDQLQRVALRVKMTNRDLKEKFENLQCTVVIIGQSTVDTKNFKVLIKEDFNISVGPRATSEHRTKEASTAFDTTGAKFGARYDGWILVVKDAGGAVVMVKSSSVPFSKIVAADPAKINGLVQDMYFGKDLEQREPPRY